MNMGPIRWLCRLAGADLDPESVPVSFVVLPWSQELVFAGIAGQRILAPSQLENIAHSAG